MTRNKLATALLVGLAVREVFSFWTGHPSDFELWVRLGYAMLHGGDPYGVLPFVPGLSFTDIFSPLNAATIAYLPFWPWVTGIMYALYSLIGIDNRFVYYFILKQPEIIGDLGLAYLLYSYVSTKNPKRSGWALWFWLLSPFAIIISGIWGMFDSLAVSLIMISIVSTSNLKRGFATGVAVFAKSVPIIYAIPTTLAQKRGWFGLLLAVGIPTLFSLSTILVMGWPLPTAGASLFSAAAKGGESMSAWDIFFYLNYLGLLAPLTPSVYRILGFVWIPAVIVFTLVSFRTYNLKTDFGLVQSLIIATLAFLIFKARVTEQYAIYLFALLVIDIAIWHPERRRMLQLMMVAVMLYLLSNNYMLTRFAAPVYPNFMQIESGVNQAIGGFGYTVNFLTGTMFTYLNIRYLSVVLRRRS